LAKNRRKNILGLFDAHGLLKATVKKSKLLWLNCGPCRCTETQY